MPSKTQHKIQFARERGVYVFRVKNSNDWTVYVQDEWTPRGIMSKRAAKNLAYAISVSRKVDLEVTFNDTDGNEVVVKHKA